MLDQLNSIQLDWGQVLRHAGWLFMIVDPHGNLPVFLSITRNDSVEDRKFMFRMSTFISLIGVLVLSIASDYVLKNLFNIHMGSFKIAGGILTMIVGVRVIVNGHDDTEQASEALHKSSKSMKESLITRAVCPLACPLMFGPGAIVVGTSIVVEAGFISGILSIFLTFIGVYLMLDFSHFFSKLLGRIGHIIMERVMMIFVAAIGIQMIYSGVQELLPDIVRTIKSVK